MVLHFVLKKPLAFFASVGLSDRSRYLFGLDSLCILKPHGQGLVLNALRFASEIRSMDELSLASQEKISANEVSLATKLIEGMADKFDPAKYKDTYSEELQKLIDAKAKGEKRQAPAPKAAKSNVIDLVAALQESLGTVKKAKKRTAA
jgi:DNA end-binding protein Ku